MTLKEKLNGVIDAIKQRFEAVPAPAPNPTPAPTPAAMNKYMLADGTEIEVEALEVGKPVMVGGSPAPEGKHTLQDGTVITVDAAGMITEVVAAPQEMKTVQQMQAALEKFAETAPPDLQKMTTILRAVFENVFGWELRRAQEEATKNAAIEIYKTGFETQKTTVQNLTDRLEKAEAINKLLFEALQSIADQPVATPAAATPAAFSGQKVDPSNIVSQLKNMQ